MAEVAPEENMVQEGGEEGKETTENGQEADKETVDNGAQEAKPILGKGMIIYDDEDSSDDCQESNVVPKETNVAPKETNVAPKETKKKESDKPVRSIEKEVGITQYVGEHKGFFGIIKQRYSDFQVNEVSNTGEIVQLTDLSVPPEPEDKPEPPTEMPPELTDAKIAEIEKMLGMPTLKLVVPDAKEDTKEEKDTEGEVRINVDTVEKDGRTAIHKAVKSRYSKVDSLFREIDGKKYIIVRKKKSQGNRGERSSWPKSKQFTHFVLYKENMDTITAINLIAYKIKLKPNLFAYGGTKDKRGKTSQLVSVNKVAPAKLTSAAKFQRGLFIGNFTFLHKPMKLGALQGNHFRIVLREVKAEDEEIETAVSSLRSQGFINYYGTQRFGTSNVATHLIGRELLKSNWQEAINLILTPRDNDFSDVNRSCKVWTETKDPEKALQELDKGSESNIEAQLLKALATGGKNDLVGALTKIPRNIRNLYLHAYQSYLWNSVASKRVEKYGLAVLPGDLVRKKGSIVKDEEAEVICDEPTPVEEEDMDTEENKSTDSEAAADSAASTNSSTVHVLTEEEAKETDITEILLPLPGFHIEYPENIIKEWYSEMLEEDGLSFSTLKNTVKAFSVGGVYRRLIFKPAELSSKTCFYNDPTLPLIQSDIDRVRSDEVEQNILTEGTNKAVILEFTLPSSSYATMALRELLKIDTSAEMQASLNSESSRMWHRGKAHMEENGHSRGDSDRGRKRHRDGDSHGWDDRRGDRHSHRGWGRGHRGGHRGRGRGFGRGGRGHNRWNDKRSGGGYDGNWSKRGRFS